MSLHGPTRRTAAGAGRLWAAPWRRAAAKAGLALAGAAIAIAIAAAPRGRRAAPRCAQVYFNNATLAGQTDDCATVFAVARQVPKTAAVATAALNQLFAGPTEAERAAGYRSPFSAATAGLLRGVRVDHGSAYVDLNDPRPLLPGATSSCGAAELRRSSNARCGSSRRCAG